MEVQPQQLDTLSSEEAAKVLSLVDIAVAPMQVVEGALVEQVPISASHPEELKGDPTQMQLQCNICGKSYSSKTALERHRSQHDGDLEQQYECDKCGKVFSRKYNKDEHIKVVHLGETKLDCEICGKKFTSYHGKEYHNKTAHLGGAKYECDECPKTFTAKASKERHMKSAHANKNFPCGICDKNFSRKYNRDSHVRTVHGTNPHDDAKSPEAKPVVWVECELCGKKFGSRNSKERHWRQKHEVNNPTGLEQTTLASSTDTIIAPGITVTPDDMQIAALAQLVQFAQQGVDLKGEYSQQAAELAKKASELMQQVHQAVQQHEEMASVALQQTHVELAPPSEASVSQSATEDVSASLHYAPTLPQPEEPPKDLNDTTIH